MGIKVSEFNSGTAEWHFEWSIIRILHPIFDFIISFICYPFPYLTDDFL